MKKLSRIISFMLACLMLVTGTAFAEPVKVRYSGTTTPGEYVGIMILDADAYTGTLDRSEIHATKIVQADENGNVSLETELDNIQIDPITGEIVNYKAMSNIELTEEVLSNIYMFDSFSERPFEENGVLYVPIVEVLNRIGNDTVSYTYNSSTKTYTGTANNGDFIITVGKDTVEIDWVDVELPGKIIRVNNTNMMPAYAIKYLLRTGDVVYSSGNNYFALTEGLKEPGYDWEADHIAGAFDKLVDSSTRKVFDSSTNPAKLNAYDWRSDGTTITKKTNASDWGTVFKIKNVPDYGSTGGHEIAISISGSIDGNIPFENDHIGLFHFKARPIYTLDESGTASFKIALQRRAEGHDGIMTYSTAFSTQMSLPYEYTGNEQKWVDYYFVADSGSSELLNGSWIQIIPIGKESEFEFCDLQLWDFGLRADCQNKIELMQPAPGYKGIEDDHIWRQEAWNRIEKYRKEDISVEVVDGSGNPVSDAEVFVNMAENEFMFGAAISRSEVLDSYIDLSTLRGQTLDSFMNNDINVGVAADHLKASGIVSTDAESGIEMINEFISRGNRTRGHAVFWDGEGLMPFNRSNQMTYQELYDNTMEYARAVAYTFKGSLSQWDVLNEPHDSNYTRTTFNTTRLYADVFKEVKKADPDTKLFVNETGMEGRPKKGYQDRVPEFLNIVKQMQSEGAEIDGIGIQAHCVNYYYPQGFYHQIDECSQVVDEVAITEYDFYNGNTDFAANHLEDTLLATFSHPKATAFVVWNIEDSMHWRWNANAAPFFDRNWTPKPAYHMWKKLINEDFATNTMLKTNAEGKAKVRAFRGDYKITCNYGGKACTVDLGNTVEGGSSVKFVVENSITGTVSNGPREQLEPVKFKNMTEAKKELDSITEPYYKSVILDRNFKKSETSDLVINGGDFRNDSAYQSGRAWGSANGMGEIINIGNWGSTIVRATSRAQTGDMRMKAEGTHRYEGTELHHETMFYTLDTSAWGDAVISTGMSASGQNDTKLADIVYSDGTYSVKAIDGYVIALEKDKLYTLDTAIVNDKLRYTVTDGNTVVGEHSCDIGNVDALKLDEVFYLFDVDCDEADIFMLHNARVFEYKDGEFIKLSDVDYETYLIDEDMYEFDVEQVEYAGAALSERADDWKLIGGSDVTADFGYRRDGHYFGAVASTTLNGEHSVAKGFESLKDGESLEITYDGYFGAYTYWMDVTGYGALSIGSHDGSVKLDLTNLRYSQYNSDLNGPYKLWLLNPADGMPINNVALSYSSSIAADRTDVKFTLTPSASGNTYDAYISIKPRIGTDEITASYPGVFTAEDVKKIDTMFITSRVQNGGTKKGGMMLGVKNLKIRRYGSTIYEDGEASLTDGEDATLGIMYDNLSRRYSPACVIIAGYRNGRMTYCDVRDYTIEPGEGGLRIDMTATSEEADYYKVFIMDGAGTISPYKVENTINIK